MSHDSRFQRLEALFHELIDLSEPQRRRRLAEIASDAPDLHDDLRDMLDVSATRMDAVDSMSQDMDRWLTEAKAIPDRIGPYRILSELGQGGMGRVYVAEQTEPVRRKVALKVARELALSESARFRFLAERQALAVLDHPNIAKVFDAGSSDQGQLWFAMELVDGRPITHWADVNGLNLEQRVELFIQVCHAIQHAHQKGLIHRDIKPSNLLVQSQEGQPQVRVIDFGIAKALEDQNPEQADLTRVGESVGTPEYMSPEQATLGEVG